MTRVPFLEGERVTLRAIEKEDDYVMIKRLWNSQFVQRMDLELIRQPYSVDTVKKACNSNLAGQSAIAAIIDVDAECVGLIAITDIDREKGIGDVGFQILPEHRGNGYATEAYGLMIDFVFEQVGLRKLIGRTLDMNDTIQHMNEKMGFEREGTLREEVFVDGEYHDVIYYGLLRSDWRNRDG